MIGGSQRKSTPNGLAQHSQPSSDDEIKKDTATADMQRRNTPNHKSSISPSRARTEQELQQVEEAQEEMVVIEYHSKIIELGHVWRDISIALDQKIPDRKLAASIRLVLLKRMRGRVTAQQQEEAMRQYKQAMYHDT